MNFGEFFLCVAGMALIGWCVVLVLGGKEKRAAVPCTIVHMFVNCIALR